MKKLAIVTCGNDEYFSRDPHEPIKALTSFRNSFGDKFDFFCLSNFKEKTKNLIKRNGFIPISIDYTNFFNKTHAGYGYGAYPPECFYMFLIPKLMHEYGYDYSLYADGDTYCNSSFKMPEILNSVHFCAVRQHEKFNKCGAVNTGVVLFNNKKCAEDKLIEDVLGLYKKFTFASDQHLFNKLIHMKKYNFREIDFTYNVMFRDKKIMDKSTKGKTIQNLKISDKIKIVHFMAGKPCKPLSEVANNYRIRNQFASLYNEIKYYE